MKLFPTLAALALLLHALSVGVALADDDQAAGADPAGIEFFEKKIRPVLVEHCYECHSADSKDVKGGLLLDSRMATRNGGESGAAVVPGKPGESLLLEALRCIPVAHQVVLELHYWERCSVAEMSAALGIPSGTVKSRLHFAKRALRVEIECTNGGVG